MQRGTSWNRGCCCPYCHGWVALSPVVAAADRVRMDQRASGWTVMKVMALGSWPEENRPTDGKAMHTNHLMLRLAYGVGLHSDYTRGSSLCIAGGISIANELRSAIRVHAGKRWHGASLLRYGRADASPVKPQCIVVHRCPCCKSIELIYRYVNSAYAP